MLWLKKTSFYVGLFALLLTIVANIFAFNQKNLRLHRETGIVMSAAASIKTSPDINSMEIFQLHAGTKVKIKEKKSEYKTLPKTVTTGFSPLKNFPPKKKRI